MRGPHEVRDPVQQQGFVAAVATVAGVLLVGAFLSVWLVAQLTGTGHGSPAQWIRSWFDSRPSWSGLATGAVVLLLAVAAVLGVALRERLSRARDRYLRWKQLREVDVLARRVSGREDELDLRERACLDFAKRVRLPNDYSPGVKLGYGVNFSKPLHMTYELTALVIIGPRMGKTTSLCVPITVDWAGPVLTCSNKRDLHDLLAGPRSRRGKVWVSDIQRIAQQPPSWYWDVLSFVRMGTDMASRASRLAGALQACNAPRDARSDAYFGPGGQTLLANLLLTCALEGLHISSVLRYLSDLTGKEVGLPDPVEVLRSNGYVDMSVQLDSDRRLTAKQLDGLVGTASAVMAFLREPSLTPWITPDPQRRAFDAQEFVRSNDTLILLSQKEDQSPSRAIVTALTMAVSDAGVALARESRGGRLERPMLFMLDEAANICPWPELPDKYSYLGSHGVVVFTVLQNKAQGVQAWGEEGMRQLVSSASVMLVGGGINDTKHLHELGELIGQREKLGASSSSGRAWSSRSISRQVQRVEIANVARLRAWPRGRLIAFSPGARPVVLRSQPWHEGPYRDEISSSDRYFGGHADDDAEIPA